MDNKIKVSGTIELDDKSYMELTGKIILDDETMSKLKENIRKEVLTELSLRKSTLIAILSKLNYESWSEVVCASVDNVFSNLPGVGHEYENMGQVKSARIVSAIKYVTDL